MSSDLIKVAPRSGQAMSKMKSVFRQFVQKNLPTRNLRGRRRGVAFVYLGLCMLVLLGVTGLVVDVGHLHMKEAQAQRAADAAALAGAMILVKDNKAIDAANTSAKGYATLNGYNTSDPNVQFTGQIDPTNPSWYTVTIRRPEPLFFIRLIPGVGDRGLVGGVATAQFFNQVPVDLQAGGGVYGEVGPTNLSVFGPQAEYQHGDPFSTIWKDSNGTINTDHVGFNGYDFKLTVPPDYAARHGNTVNVEIFDPDTWNAGNNGPDGVTDWDEIRPPYSGINPQPLNNYTATKFTLYKVDPADPTKIIEISSVTYRDDQTTNNKWVTPPNFTIDAGPAGNGPGEYRINVQTLDGSSENGFELRAGPPLAANQAFDPDNGTMITATGMIPINFNKDGVTEITLGSVPEAAAGGSLVIEKFDTDIQSKTVFYTSDPPATNEPAGGWPGILAGNGEWKADDPIPLLTTYKTATWKASYTAGRQDTSLWRMSYNSPGAVGDSSVKLVGSAGKHY